MSWTNRFLVNALTSLMFAISFLASAEIISFLTFGLPIATIKSPGTVFPILSSSSFAKPTTVIPAPVCVVSKFSSVFTFMTWLGSSPKTLISFRIPSRISLPVGSHGILHEVIVLANDSGLCASLDLPEVEAKKSAGPATAVLVTISENALGELSGLISKPIRVISSLCR